MTCQFTPPILCLVLEENDWLSRKKVMHCNLFAFLF